MAFMLARETGWSEQFIVWELPFSRFLQYRHCALRGNDVWTVPLSAAPKLQASAVEEHLAKLEKVDSGDWDDW